MSIYCLPIHITHSKMLRIKLIIHTALDNISKVNSITVD